MAKVSIIMPVYNGERYLKEAIDSIIHQSFVDWEFIIINEFGSSAAATEILQSYEEKDSRIRVIQNKTRLRIAESLNVGIRASTGEYVARMDADDIAGTERLRQQVDYMDAHTDVGLLGIHPTVFGEEEWDWNTEYDPEVIAASTLFFLPCLHPTVMIRKSVLNQYGLQYDPDYYCTEDFDFFERVLQHTKASNLDEPSLFYYRRYSSAATYTNGKHGDEVYLEVMKRALGRLSLSFSEEELSLLYIHRGCKDLRGKKLSAAMEQLDLLLKKIFQQNLQVRCFDSLALFHCLHKRWKHMLESDIYGQYGWERAPKDIQETYQHSIFSREQFCEEFGNRKMIDPQITVLMPTYNGEKYLYEAIKSVEEQTYPDWELLIISDPSEDSTVLIIQEYQKYDKRIRLIANQVKAGPANALNQGIDEAKGKYIARIDDDDIALPSRLEKQIKLLEERPDISLVGSWQRHFGKEEWIHQPLETPEEMKAVLLFKCDVCHSTIMFRKKDFVDNGLYYSSEYLSEDYELWTRAVQKLKFYTIQEVLGEYRVNGENITASKITRLESEAQGIIARTLKDTLHIRLPKSDMILLSGWENPFFYGGEEQKNLRAREEKLLQKIENQNAIYHAYDQTALKTVLEQRRIWAGIAKGSLENRCTMPKITIRKRIKNFIKRILKPIYYPFKRRYEDRLIQIENSVQQLISSVSYLQKTIQDLDGHLYDYYDYLSQGAQSRNMQLQALINAVQASLSLEFNHFGESVFRKNEVMRGELLQEIAKIHGDSLRSTESWFQQRDTYTKKLMDNLAQAMDTRIWNAERLVNQTTDERVWKLEQTVKELLKELTQSTDTRVWNAEKLINQTTDERVWKLEETVKELLKELTQTTDTRIWNAEKLINQVTDSRIWQTEQFNEQLVKRLTDEHIQNMGVEIPRHIEFTYRDLMIVLERQKSFLPPDDIKIETQHPVANESLDYLYPHGTIRDNTRYPRFVEKCEEIFGEKKRLAFLDLGCSGGGMVLEAALKGHISIGLEGSDFSQKEQRAEWRLLGERLKTCDITKPFLLTRSGEIQKFDIITAWEVLEHISEADLAALFTNIRRHLSSNGLFIASIANWDDIDPVSGVDWHITKHPYEWWKSKFEENGYSVCTELFETIDLARGGYNPPHCYEVPYLDVDKEKSFHIVVKL